MEADSTLNTQRFKSQLLSNPPAWRSRFVLVSKRVAFLILLPLLKQNVTTEFPYVRLNELLLATNAV